MWYHSRSPRLHSRHCALHVRHLQTSELETVSKVFKPPGSQAPNSQARLTARDWQRSSLSERLTPKILTNTLQPLNLDRKQIRWNVWALQMTGRSSESHCRTLPSSLIKQVRTHGCLDEWGLEQGMKGWMWWLWWMWLMVSMACEVVLNGEGGVDEWMNSVPYSRRRSWSSFGLEPDLSVTCGFCWICWCWSFKIVRCFAHKTSIGMRSHEVPKFSEFNKGRACTEKIRLYVYILTMSSKVLNDSKLQS